MARSGTCSGGNGGLGGHIVAGDILYFMHRHFRIVAPVVVVVWTVGVVGLARWAGVI